MRKYNGFTLIEILVALMIFAIIGVLAARSLQSIIHVHTALKKDNRALMQVMVTMTLLRRDMSEMIDRPTRSDNSVPGPTLTMNGSQVIFTRGGLINPLQARVQSNMQRVGYALQGGNFVRLSWDVLDPLPNTKPEVQVLLQNVESVQWQCIASDGEKSTVWPMPPKTDALQQQAPVDPLPVVMLMVMKVKGQGTLEGEYPIPSRGYNASAQTP